MNNLKSLQTAYISLVPFGLFGSHRFYMGAYITGGIMAALFCLGFFQMAIEPSGRFDLLRIERWPDWWKFLLAWCAFDAVILFFWVREHNYKTEVLNSLEERDLSSSELEGIGNVSRNRKKKFVRQMIKEGTIEIEDGVAKLAK